MGSVVPPGENVWRSAVFPVAFKKKQLSPKAFFKLYSDETRPFCLEMSLVRERYAPILAMVHGFGCRLAASQNVAQQSKGKLADRVYCGAYQISARSIEELGRTPNLPEVKVSQVIHVVEAGEFAHANLRLEVDTQGDEDAIEPIKTLIIDRLWERSRGPAIHVCDCDAGVNPHPSALLQQSPLGPYVDTRSKLAVAFAVAVYFVFHYPRLWSGEVLRKSLNWAKQNAKRLIPTA
jgi:hypothetical protein